MLPPAPPGRVCFGAFEVDLRSGELRKHGMKIKLHQQPFQVLAMLLEHRGEIVTREQLREGLWPADTFVAFDKGLDTAIHRLRSALGDSADSPRFVETLPRRGYRFIAPVVQQPVQEATREPQSTAPSARPSQLRFLASVCALVLLIVIGLAVSKLRSKFSAAHAPRRLSSLVVLPLVNMSGDPAQDYFADGMTDELTIDLGRIPGFRVIARTSAVFYKGSRKTPSQIAQELNVDAVVEGAVLRSGNRVRITTELVEASTNRQLWAQSYERDLGDVLALQNEVAPSIATEVKITLSPQERTRLVQGRRVNPQAYEAYLNGLYEWNKWTEKGLRSSVEYFEKAIQADPAYAPAWAGLSDAYGLLRRFRYLPDRASLETSRQAALKALELDDTLSEAHIALATISLEEWSWAAAEGEMRRAIELDPNNATAHQWYGYLLRAQGRYEESIVEMRIAQELDPLTPNKRQSLGANLYVAGHYDEALQEFLKVPDGDANSQRRHRLMAEIYERKGMEREALAELLKMMQLANKPELAASVEREYFLSGYAKAKKNFLSLQVKDARLRAANPDSPPLAFEIAGYYASLGLNETALEWLNRAFRERDEALIYLKADDRFESLRFDPRFKDLVRRLGLPS